MNTPTPRTDAAYTQRPNEGAWDFKVRQEKTMESLERELTTITEQRDEARKLAEKYRYLSCDSQEQADETLLPWENNQTTEL